MRTGVSGCASWFEEYFCEKNEAERSLMSIGQEFDELLHGIGDCVKMFKVCDKLWCGLRFVRTRIYTDLS